MRLKCIAAININFMQCSTARSAQGTGHIAQLEPIQAAMLHVLQQSRVESVEKRKAESGCSAEALPLMKMKMKLRLPQADPDKMMTLTMAHIMRIISQRSAEPVPESGAYPASYTSPPLSLYHIQPPLCAARENVTQADSNVCLWSPGCPTSPHPPAPHHAC